MTRLLFYFSYALRNIRRGGRWTTLAIFCIAAGVAAVVALHSLGLAIGETLQSSVREDNKGDVLLYKGNRGSGAQALNIGGEELTFFTGSEIEAVSNYVESNLGGGRISGYTLGGNIAIAGVNAGIFGSQQFVSTYLINPQTYPPTHTITALDPPGVPLSELLSEGNAIVVSENMAQNQDLVVGDTVRISRTDELFTVRGIVSAQEEATIRNPLNGFFGFAYLSLARVQEVIDPEIGINRLVIALDKPLTEANSETVANELRRIASQDGERVRYDTAMELLERNQVISQVLGDFIVVMGLGALLIGGVGIMNTMLVLVRRRRTEIAAMKTFGMKSRQVALLFLAEALLLGLAGSIFGSIAGIWLGGAVKQFGEQFLQQEIVWRIHPEALLYGFVLGMLVTTIFGIAPILTALQIRPNIILRPNESGTAGLGILQTIGLLVLTTLLIGLIVGQIVRPSFGLVSSFSDGWVSAGDAYIWGIISVTITLSLLGIITLLLWVIVWLVGKLPTFGNVELQLALRNLSTHRMRTATTLLALSAGMFALSSITFVGEGTRQMLNVQLSRSFGGNVLAFPLTFGPLNVLSDLAEQNMNNALEDVPGVQSRTKLAAYNVDLRAINGENIQVASRRRDLDNPFDTAELAPLLWDSFTVWESDNPAALEDAITLVQGRNLTEADSGQPVIVGPAESAGAIGVDVGSILTYQVGTEQVDYTVVGLVSAGTGFFGGNVYAPKGSTGTLRPDFQLYSFQVDQEYSGQAVVELSSISIPPTMALDVSFIDTLIDRLIDQFAAIPTVVGLLSLFVAALIMANTVALNTLERRRQIGILKALGLKNKRVLRVMLLESSIVALLSAVLGLGLSSLFVTLFTSITGTPIPLPTDSRLPALGLILAAIVIGWVATFLSANTAVRERVMNVLRYD